MACHVVVIKFQSSSLQLFSFSGILFHPVAVTAEHKPKSPIHRLTDFLLPSGVLKEKSRCWVMWMAVLQSPNFLAGANNNSWYLHLRASASPQLIIYVALVMTLNFRNLPLAMLSNVPRLQTLHFPRGPFLSRSTPAQGGQTSLRASCCHG